ncbi:MAG: hypothetical protein RL095_2061 [Verrucomicrobiota bacterium]|jgi:hypothetical protein
MPFDHGSVSFSLFKLDGELPEDLLERLESKAMKPLEKVGEEPVSGFAARHILETEFTQETCWIGDFCHFHYATAVRRVPPALLAAECAKRELAAIKTAGSEGSGYLSRKRRAEIKEEARKELIKQGVPQIRGIPVLIDPQASLMYIGIASAKGADEVATAILEALEVPMLPITVETSVAEVLATSGEQLDPIQLVEGFEDGTERWMGRDFLTWVWFMAEQDGGKFTVPDLGEFAVGVDGPLTLAAEGEGSHESVLRKGVPTGAPEAAAALASGKKLRAARLMIGRPDEAWHLSLDADSLGFRSVKLPDGEKMNKQDRFEERAEFLHTLQAALRALMARFAKEVSGRKRGNTVEAMRDWALGRGLQEKPKKKRS